MSRSGTDEERATTDDASNRESAAADRSTNADERPHVLTVVGARPQFIKAAAVSRAFDGRFRETVVHTGQHYDEELSAIFFDELGLAEPDYDLGVGSDTHAKQTAAVTVEVERVIDEVEPDAVLVYGDTNSTLAAAIAASKRPSTLVHVEAGLRSGDRSMPEEVNRIATDHLSDVLYAPSESAVETLEREGIVDNVAAPGDVMYDTLLAVHDRLSSGLIDPADELTGPAGPIDPHELPDPFVLATVHRAANTDDPDRLSSIVDGLAAVDRPVVLPAHPRTVDALEREGEFERAADALELVDPVGYRTFLWLLGRADCVATDSGGVQKEAFYLDTPCVTMRETTEWDETIEAGWNELVGADASEIASAVDAASTPPEKPTLYGGGMAAERIADDLERRMRRTKYE